MVVSQRGLRGHRKRLGNASTRPWLGALGLLISWPSGVISGGIYMIDIIPGWLHPSSTTLCRTGLGFVQSSSEAPHASRAHVAYLNSKGFDSWSA